MAVVPITTRLNTPVDDIGDKALERARRDFQETVRATNMNGLQTRTQTDTGGQNDQRRRGAPLPGEGTAAAIAPADPRDRARSDAARRGRATTAPTTPTPANDAPAGAPRPLPDPIGPPIPRELLPQLPTPPAGSSLVAEGLSGRSDLLHKPVRTSDSGQPVEAPGDEMSGTGETARTPQYRLNSAAPPEIASRIAAFMRTGQLDRRPFAVTPVPGLVQDDPKPASQARSVSHLEQTSAPAPAPQTAQTGSVDLLADFDRSARPQVMPSLPIPMQAQTIAMMPAGQFAPVRTADHRMPVAGVSRRVSEEDEQDEAQIREQDAGRAQKSRLESTNPFFADTPPGIAHPFGGDAPANAGPMNPLFGR